MRTIFVVAFFAIFFSGSSALFGSTSFQNPRVDYEDRFNVIPLASYKEGSVLPIEKICRIDSPTEEHCFLYDAKIKHYNQSEMLPYFTYRIYFRYDPLLASDWALSFPLFSISATDFHINGQREMPMRMNFPINKAKGEITVSFITADYQNQMSGYVLRHQESTYIDVAIDWFFLGLMTALGIYLTTLTVQRRFHIPYVLVTLIVLCGLWKTINSTWILPTYLIRIGFYQWLTQNVIWQIFWAEIQVFTAVAMFSYVPTHFLLVRYRLLSRRYAMFYATCCVLMIPVGVAGIRCYSQFHSLIDLATASLLLIGSGVQVHLLWRLLRLNDRNARFIAFGIFILNASIAWNIANYTLFGNSLPILEKPGMFVFVLMHAIALSQDFADSFDENLILTTQLEKRNSELNRLNTTLAERVAIQTAEIRSILDHIPQGVLRLIPGGIISDSTSARAIEMFGIETIQGRTFREVAIDQSQASADERDQAWQSIQAIIGEDLLAFDMNRDKLPSEIQLPERVLAVTYTPESYGSLECRNLLLTVTDITVEKKLAAARERQDAIMDLVRELVHVEDDAKLVQFISSTDRLVGLMAERIGTGESLSTETLKFLFIMLHTIKGEARTLNLGKFSSEIHSIESAVNSMQLLGPPFSASSILDMHRRVVDLLEEYRQCFTQVLKKTKEDSLIALPKEFLRDSARQIDQLNAASAVRQMTDETFNVLEQHVDSMIRTVYPKIFTQLHTHLWSFESNIRAIARQLSKENPRLVVNGDDLRIGDQTRLALTQSLVHLLRNHLDHGIESAEERLPQQKPAYGTITISTKQLPENRFRLTFSDDGRGLAIARLRAKAQKGSTADKSDSEIAALIWESGMSTAEQVSEISGRGVGMAAIKEFIEGAGGTITIGLSGSEGADYRPFALRIELPC